MELVQNLNDSIARLWPRFTTLSNDTSSVKDKFCTL